MAISARNQLAGTVSATERGAFWSARTLRNRRCVRSFATKTAMPFRGLFPALRFWRGTMLQNLQKPLA